MSPQAFARLRGDFFEHVASLDEVFVQDLFAGSQPENRLNVRVVTELAWHSSFARTMPIRPTPEQLSGFKSDYLLLDLPSFVADPVRHAAPRRSSPSTSSAESF